MGWAAGFSAGTQMGRSAIDAYRQAEEYQNQKSIKEGMADIAAQKGIDTYTPEQGADLEAMANAKDAEGKPYYTVGTDDTGKYTVTPNFQNETGAAPEQYAPSTMAAKGVSFLGKNYDAPLTDSQETGARQQAMAGVMERHGDVEGAMRFRQQAQQGLRDEVRFGNEQAMFALNKEAAERQGESAKIKAAQEAAGRHINEVLQKNGGDVRKAAAQMMTETGAEGLEGVNVTYEVGRDGLGRFVKTMPDGTRDVGQPVKSGAEGDLQIWQQIASAASDPKTIGDWYSDKLKRDLDAEKTKADQGNKDRDFGLRVSAEGRADKLAASQIASHGIGNQLTGMKIKEHEQTLADKKAHSDLTAEYGQAIDDGDEKAADAAFKKLRVFARQGRGDPAQSAFIQKVDAIMQSDPKITRKDAIAMANQKAEASPASVYDQYAKPQNGMLPEPASVEKALAARSAFLAKQSAATPATGTEQVIQSGPNKGKTAVYDGKGWVLK